MNQTLMTHEKIKRLSLSDIDNSLTISAALMNVFQLGSADAKIGHTGCFFCAVHILRVSHGRCVKRTMLWSSGVTQDTWEFCVE